jgi:hypothetical protein
MMTPEFLEKVLSQAQTSACHSWEYGTVFEALLEYQDPSLSIFNNPILGGQIPVLAEEEVLALKYVKPFILTDSNQLCEGNGRYLSLYLLESRFGIYRLRSIYPIIHQAKLHQFQLRWFTEAERAACFECLRYRGCLCIPIIDLNVGPCAVL